MCNNYFIWTLVCSFQKLLDFDYGESDEEEEKRGGGGQDNSVQGYSTTS